MIGKLLCKIGIHKWKDNNTPTLRCSRCGYILCLWAERMQDPLKKDNEIKTKEGLIPKEYHDIALKAFQKAYEDSRLQNDRR